MAVRAWWTSPSLLRRIRFGLVARVAGVNSANVIGVITGAFTTVAPKHHSWWSQPEGKVGGRIKSYLELLDDQSKNEQL